MERIQEDERLRVNAQITKEGLCPDDPEWHAALQEYTHRIDFLLPRLFRGPFFVALYAVYESAVTEIARLIQDKKSQKVTINDLKGDFLGKSQKILSISWHSISIRRTRHGTESKCFLN